MNIQKIYEFDLANGLGVRVSIFVSGCTLRCPGCFNQQAWDFNSGVPLTKDLRQKIKDILDDDKYAGLSILGGEPFDQSDGGIAQLIELCDYAHSVGKDVWIWSGYYISEIVKDPLKKKLLSHCDVLVDGPYRRALVDDEPTPFRGSYNQEIITGEELQKWLCS